MKLIFFFVVRLWLGTSSHYPNQPSYNSKAGREGGALQGKSLLGRLNTFESSSFGNCGTKCPQTGTGVASKFYQYLSFSLKFVCLFQSLTLFSLTLITP